MSMLILMRHGQSVWNLQNLFTGWVDVPLSQEGIQEALEGGRQIGSVDIDVIYTSTLARAQMTAFLAMSQHTSSKVPLVLHEETENNGAWHGLFDPAHFEKACIPVHVAWELNERMYGKLQGLNKAETAEKYGKEQVHIWRRSYDVPPPEGESLKMCAERTLPYFQDKIVPDLKQGKNVFISAHGNSLRAISMQIDGLSEEEVLSLEIPTGQPIAYSYEEGHFQKISLDARQRT